MTWKRVAAISGLTGIAGLLSSAVAGNLLVRWYDFNAFEGAPEFFVIVFALAGLIVGGLVGIVVSLLLAAASRFNLPTAAGISSAVMLVLVAASTGTSRLLADIPPEIDGEQVYLSVELRFPSGHASPSSMPGVGYLKFGATGIRGIRKQEKGLLFTEDARLVDGQWTAPGVVRIFTSRGGRRIDAGIGTSPLASFDVPVPAHPTAGSREWSEWLPRLEVRERAAEQFTYRYKVVRQSEPLRVESFGRLTIETIAQQMVLHSFDARRHRSFFYTARSSERVSALSDFRILHDGHALPGFERAEAIALLKKSSPTALLVHAARSPHSTPCYLLVDDGSEIEIRPFGSCQAPIVGRPLTSDPHRFAAARDVDRASGWVDRQTFAVPGLFLVDGNVLDTRSLTVTPIDLPPGAVPWGLPPPLALSPDERSFVWFTHSQSQERPMLGVTNWKANRSYEVRIDRARMRYIGFETLDPAWVAHHFAWHRGPDGVDVLEERPGFVPLPYRGQLTLGKPGEAQGYLLLPAGEQLRDEVVRILVEELHGKRLSDTCDGTRRIRLDDKVVNVSLGSTLVAVTMNFGEADPELMRKVAAHLDAAMATGQYDALFRASTAQGR
jgi:hypothetical protein